MSKWNPSQEAINRARRPRTIRKWLNGFLIGIIGAGIILIIAYFYFKKPAVNFSTDKISTENELKKQLTAINKPNTSINLLKEENSPSFKKSYEKIPSNSNIEKTEVIEDFSSYINRSITNSSDITNIAVTVVDELGNISSSISSSIASIYNQSGNQSNTGLIRSSFIHKSGFQELFEGNSEIIDKLKLYNHADYIAIGKISYSYRNGNLIEETFVCTISLNINIISSNEKHLYKSITLSAIGNGVTEYQSKEYAIEKLLSKFKTEYSSL